jgi:hypothetical protein
MKPQLQPSRSRTPGRNRGARKIESARAAALLFRQHPGEVGKGRGWDAQGGVPGVDVIVRGAKLAHQNSVDPIKRRREHGSQARGLLQRRLLLGAATAQ